MKYALKSIFSNILFHFFPLLGDPIPNGFTPNNFWININ